MTIAAFPVPPVVKSVTVRCSPARAFALFAEDFGRWWPLSRTHTGPDPEDCALEPASADGCSNAQPMGAKHRGARFWRTSRHIALPFHGLPNYRPGQEQLVEIRFTPEGPGTRVELTHSGWEKLGDAAASLRQRYDRGWAIVFERHFVEYANGPRSEARRQR